MVTQRDMKTWRTDTVTEGIKSDDGKLPMHLISPTFLDRIAEVLKFGAQKYGDRNWENGIKFSRIYAAAMRHLLDFWDGEDRDTESDMSHLSHAATCLMFLVHYSAYKEYDEFDDRPWNDEKENE